MRIERPDLSAALREFVAAGHGVIVGAPGIGKTHSLREFARVAEAAGTPFLWLAVDRIGGATEEELRLELNYEGEFGPTLKAEFDARPEGGYVIIDGFDAGRDAAGRARLTQRIEQVMRLCPAAWRVIVSVRIYDANKSPHLLGLFGSNHTPAPAKFTHPGITVRHFSIPELDEQEVRQVVGQLPGMDVVLSRASQGLRRLLAIPFNLWLLERILTRSNSVAQIAALSSEIELLALFWHTFISERDDDAARRLLLSKAAGTMVSAGRLAVRKAEVYDAAAGEAWRGLLSDELLSEDPANSEMVAFKHNILFDYAAAVLLIDETAEAVSEFIRADVSRPLFMRPSLVYFFARLWHRNREEFWHTVWALLPASDVPTRLVARLIPPYVIASQARASADLDPLLVKLAANESIGRAAVVRVLFALRFVGKYDAQLWAGIGVALANRPSPEFAWELGDFLDRTLELRGAEQGVPGTVGTAARVLLGYALDNHAAASSQWFDSLGAVRLLPMVCKTFSADPVASRRLIERVLSLQADTILPIRYFYTLSDEVDSLVADAPDLVATIYKAVFEHEEQSDEPTRMGGIVLPLTSNRRQDFEMCQYCLGRSFGSFLALAPATAIPTIVELYNNVATRRLQPEEIAETDSAAVTTDFAFLGRNRVCLPGNPFFEFPSKNRELKGMVDELLSQLTNDEPPIEPEKAVELISDHAVAAPTWGVLLQLGTQRPSRFASVLHELVRCRPILLAWDLGSDLGAFVEAAYPHWSAIERESFEATLIELPRHSIPGVKDGLVRYRVDALLGRIPEGSLASEPARHRIAEIRASGAEVPREVESRFTVSSSEYGVSEWLQDKGVDVATPANRRFLALRERVVTFADRWNNEVPTPEAVATVLPELAEGWEGFREQGDASEEVYASAWTSLAGAAGSIVRTKPAADSEVYALCLKILRHAASFPSESVSESRNEEYTHASWSPSPRTEGIEGLSHALAYSDDAEGRALLRELAESNEPSERLLVALYARVYARSSAQTYWAVMTTMVPGEGNAVVAEALLAALTASSSIATRRDELARQLIEAHIATSSSSLAKSIADWLAYAAFTKRYDWALSALGTVFHDNSVEPETLYACCTAATLRAVDARLEESARSSAREWVVALIGTLHERFRIARAQPDEEQQRRRAETVFRVIARVIHATTVRVPVGGTDLDEPEEGGSDALTLRRYFASITPVLDALLAFAEEPESPGIPAPTTYRIMELLAKCLPAEPPAVVRMAARAAAAAKRHNYHFDSMAVKEMVDLVETILADYRDQFSSGQPLADLMLLLDVFAEAGWPEATSLIWRLDEVFR